MRRDRWTPRLRRLAGDLSARLKYARALLQNRRLDDAAVVFGEILLLDPACEPALLGLGSLLLRLGRHQDAHRIFEQLVRIHPEIARGHVGLADALAGTGRLEEAKEHYHEALRQDASLIDVYLKLADVSLRGGAREDAVSACLAAIRVDPSDPRPRARLEQIGGRTIQRVKSAGAPSSSVATVVADESDSGSVVESSANVGTGTAKMREGDYEGAVAQMREVLSGGADLPKVQLRLIKCLCQIQRYADGLAEADRLSAAHPRFHEAHLWRGDLLVFLNRHDDAFRAYQSALLYEPGAAEAHLRLGILHQRRGRLLEAFLELHIALAIDPDLASAQAVLSGLTAGAPSLGIGELALQRAC